MDAYLSAQRTQNSRNVPPHAWFCAVKLHFLLPLSLSLPGGDHPGIVQLVKHIADNANSFDQKVIGRVSQAAAPLALWVKANIESAPALPSSLPSPPLSCPVRAFPASTGIPSSAPSRSNPLLCAFLTEAAPTSRLTAFRLASLAHRRVPPLHALLLILCAHAAHKPQLGIS